MDYKLIIAKNLRDGLNKIKSHCIQEFQNNPLNEQWWYLERKMVCDIDFHEHKKLVEDNFAYHSREMLKKISGD